MSPHGVVSFHSLPHKSSCCLRCYSIKCENRPHQMNCFLLLYCTLINGGVQLLGRLTSLGFQHKYSAPAALSLNSFVLQLSFQYRVSGCKDFLMDQPQFCVPLVQLVQQLGDQDSCLTARRSHVQIHYLALCVREPCDRLSTVYPAPHPMVAELGSCDPNWRKMDASYKFCVFLIHCLLAVWVLSQSIEVLRDLKH